MTSYYLMTVVSIVSDVLEKAETDNYATARLAYLMWMWLDVLLVWLCANNGLTATSISIVFVGAAGRRR